MTFAIIETGAKQYKVKQGDKIQIEKIPGDFKEGDKIFFDSVVLYDNGEETLLGQPYLENKKVEARFLEEKKGKKIRIQKFKAKSNYSVVKGHRQNYFVVEIVKV